MRRFEMRTTAEDLSEAITLAREAVVATPEPLPARPDHLTVLVGALVDRYQIAGAAEDIDEAITLAREVVASTPEDYSARALIS